MRSKTHILENTCISIQSLMQGIQTVVYLRQLRPSNMHGTNKDRNGNLNTFKKLIHNK